MLLFFLGTPFGDWLYCKFIFWYCSEHGVSDFCFKTVRCLKYCNGCKSGCLFFLFLLSVWHWEWYRRQGVNCLLVILSIVIAGFSYEAMNVWHLTQFALLVTVLTMLVRKHQTVFLNGNTRWTQFLSLTFVKIFYWFIGSYNGLSHLMQSWYCIRNCLVTFVEYRWH